MFIMILFFIIALIVWYYTDAFEKDRNKKYLPQLEINTDSKTNKPVKASELVKVAKKIESNTDLNPEDLRLLKDAYNMTPNDYKIEETEKHNSTDYLSTNEVPIKGKTRIRETKDGYIYFSDSYQLKPDHLYKVLDYSWGGPRYETTYSTSTTSKNKHLVPIINQKRTGTSKTTSITTAHDTLCQLLLIDTKTNDKILSEANISSDQNKVISRFKLWPDTSNQQTVESSNDTSNSSTSDLLDELPKLKKMLDDGIITQEEFDAKKKQILNI